ncbi:hypothetical protein J4230_00920 [Candidatus Woesearchaeota archaeon]|nr:hypothetical protein [Candidatus Woesearchaeota archaeon]
MVKYTKLALAINIVVFSLIFLLHLFRIVSNYSAKFGNWIVPMWVSYLALIALAFLIYINYKAL